METRKFSRSAIRTRRKFAEHRGENFLNSALPSSTVGAGISPARHSLAECSWALTTGMEFHQFSKMYCSVVIEYENPAAMRGQWKHCYVAAG